MDSLELRADCRRCAALCCVSLAFDRSELFGFDKAAGVPCPHVTSRYRCRIHASLAQRGFAGCERYDCLGAGQRVTEELFPGRSWRESPALAESMFDAFRALREVHELLALLRALEGWPLDREREKKRSELIEALTPARGWSLDALAEIEQSSVPRRVRAFLAELRGVARRKPPRRLPLVP